MHRSFRVLQSNLRKSPSAALELSTIAIEQEEDAILLQELPKNFKWPDSSFDTFIPNENNAPSGVVIRSNLNAIPLSSPDSNISTALIRLGNQAVVLASAYWNNSVPDLSFLPTLESAINIGSFSCILGMDANAHSPTWGIGATRDARGASLEDSASLMGLQFLGSPNHYTWSNGSLRSSIDVTLASSSLAIHAIRSCLQEMAFSDHLPILTNFDDIISTEPICSWVETSCLEETFTAFIGSRLHHVTSRLQTAFTPGDIDEVVTLLTTCLQEACNVSMRKKSKSPRPSRPWGNKELSKLRNLVVALRRCYQSTSFYIRSFFKGLYRACHNKLKAAIRREKHLSWITLCQEVSSAAWSSIHQYISKGRRGSLGPPLLKHNDGTPLTPEETCHEVLQHYFPTDWTAPTPSIDWLQSYNQEPAIAVSEVLRAIRRCGQRKSPGPDRLGIRCLLLGGSTLHKTLSQIFTKCLRLGHFPTPWKSGLLVLIPKQNSSSSNQLEKYRPITLLNTLAKVLERCILARLQWIADYQGWFSPQQFGFLPGRSAEMALDSINNNISEGLQHLRKTLAIGLDISYAFDTVQRHTIIQGLHDLNCPEELIQLSASFLRGRQVIYNAWNATLTSTTLLGVSQGAALSPFYFNIVARKIHLLPRPNNSEIISFADDFTVLIHFLRRFPTREINQFLKQLFHWGKTQGLTFNPRKTQACLFHWKAKRPDYHGIHFQNQPILIDNTIKSSVLPLIPKETSSRKNQSFDDFVTKVKNKAVDCDFGDLTESLIRDRIVLGVLDKNLMERYLQDPDLTLSKAIALGRAAESSRTQLKEIKEEVTVNKLSSYKETSSNKNTEHKYVKKNHKLFKACGKCASKHEYGNCPAYGKQCHKCKKPNHYAKCCKNKIVHDIAENDIYMHVLSVDNILKDGWFETIYIQGHPINFKIDTGADVNILPLASLKLLQGKYVITPTNKNIFTYTKERIPIVGEVELECQFQSKKSNSKFFVVKCQTVPILGLKYCSRFGLIEKVNSLHQCINNISSEVILNKYKDVFEGVRLLKNKQSILIKEDAIPQVYTARRLPLAMREPVREELEKMSKLGVIKKINKPTEWSHPMVVVKKPNGDVRICIDPRKLNYWIKRERYMMPSPEEVLALIQKANIYTVLDEKYAFWQIPLTDEASLLTTMSTPYGRYCYTRMPYGLSSAPENFQRIIHQLYLGVPNVVTYMDDVLIHSDSETEHLKILGQVLEIARENELKFDKTKTQLMQPSVRYLGHIVSTEGIRPLESKVKAILDMPRPQDKDSLAWSLLCAKTYALARSLASPKELSFVEYDYLIKLLTDHFCPKPNLIVQRFFFNKRNQGDESVSAYVAELRKLSENCEFVDLEDRLRDRLVCGLRKESIVKKLLSESNLTFEKALNIAICDESASADASVLQERITEVNMMKKASKTEPPKFKSGKVHVKEFKKMNNKIICIRCKGNHMPNVCKFRNAKCFKCGKIGHVQRACLTNVVADGLGPNILGRQWFEAFRLKINFLNHIETNPFSSEFEEVFKQEIDAYNGPLIHIDIPENAEPKFVKARTVPFALRNLVDEKLKVLEEQGVIEPLRGGKLFTKVDMAQAYQQLKIDEESSEVLAINTHRGLYKMKRLPFGLNSAGGTFQRFMDTLLSGIDGVAVYLDDVLIAGRLKIDYRGVHPSDEKLRAIKDARPPCNKKELMSFLGLLNYYERFLKNKSTVVEPLPRLLDSNSPWKWRREHQRSFDKAKDLISSESVLALFDDNLPILINCDSSEYGIGAVLSQIHHGVEKPVMFASRTLNKTERRYAVIDKEALAKIYGFYRSQTTAYYNEKPMVDLSPRLQRLVLQLQHYDFDLKYIPGKNLYIADALSRDYIANDLFITPEIEISQNNQVLMVTYSNNRHQDLVEATNNDPVLKEVKNYIENGWPIHKKTMNPFVKPFWDIKEELFEWEGLLCRGVKLVIPKRRRNHILSLLHKAHRGINSTLSLARSTFYWPGMCQEVEEFVKKCRICQKYSRNNTKEPLIPNETGNYPFQKIGVDLFEIEGRKYLGIVDYYTKYPEVFELRSTKAEMVIEKLKEVFARCGVPEIMMTDNGPPFQSTEMMEFAKEWNALLLLRNTEHNSLPSPAIMLYGRKQRLFLPMKTTLMNESRICEDSIRKQYEANQSRKNMKFYFNRHARDLSSLENGQSVLVRQEKQWSPAKVIAPGVHPRSYLLEDTKGSVLRRNRRDLRPAGTLSGPTEKESRPEKQEQLDPQPSTSSQREETSATTRTRCGRLVKPPHYCKKMSYMAFVLWEYYLKEICKLVIVAVYACGRRRGERSNPAAIVERPTVRQRGIMVWGAIAYDSRSPLLHIQGTMTAQRYVDDVLRPVTLPYLQGVPNALYQQDNARPHTARISQQALQDVQMLPWPPYSPDLSPIEHVWDIIGRRLHALPMVALAN
ncbi:K02A2.6-like, partial [Cordylochernes scorpioides]